MNIGDIVQAKSDHATADSVWVRAETPLKIVGFMHNKYLLLLESEGGMEISSPAFEFEASNKKFEKYD